MLTYQRGALSGSYANVATAGTGAAISMRVVTSTFIGLAYLVASLRASPARRKMIGSIAADPALTVRTAQPDAARLHCYHRYGEVLDATGALAVRGAGSPRSNLREERCPQPARAYVVLH